MVSTREINGFFCMENIIIEIFCIISPFRFSYLIKNSTFSHYEFSTFFCITKEIGNFIENLFIDLEDN